MIIISPLNPITFVPMTAYVPPKHDYVQKYSHTDRTNLQIITSLTQNLKLTVKSENGEEHDLSHKLHTVNTPAFNARIWSFELFFGNYKGINHLLMEINGSPEGRSYDFHVGEHTDLTKITYFDERITNSPIYYGLTNDRHINYFCLRIEGGFQMHNMKPKQVDTKYIGGNLRYQTLHSRRYFTREFYAGDVYGISPELFKTVHYAFGCDSVFIDDVGYLQYEGADWQQNIVEHYPLLSCSTELVRSGQKVGVAQRGLFAHGALLSTNTHYDNSIFITL
jgi:hypothetical protein